MRSLSIRYKFLAVVVATTMAVLLAYLALAINLFESDKEAYIYDSSTSLVASISAEVGALVDGVHKTMSAVLDLAPQTADEGATAIVRRLFENDADVVHLAIYQRPPAGAALGEPIVDLIKADFLAMHGIEAPQLGARHAPPPGVYERLKGGEIFVYNSSLATGVPLLTVALVKDRAGEPALVAVADLQQDRLLKSFSRSEVFTTYLIDGAGNLLAHRDAARVIAKENISDPAFVREILGGQFRSGAKELTGNDGERRITAYAKLDVGGLVVVSQIPRETAFAASRRLVERSVLFAAALLAASLLISMLFTKSLTGPINKLFQATRRIAQGDFSVRVDVRSRDEIGALSTSFNTMASEITDLMGQVADKARMEKELETARLVQENLFPAADLDLADCELAGFYSPASECGGDWWGYFRLGEKLVVLVGDATGHGVPAALITAAAQSCCTTVQQVYKRTPGMKLSPATLMADLNAAVHYAAKGGMNMTFFIAVVDFATGEVTYANASHELPVICRAAEPADETPIESYAVDMLISDPDVCLGETPEATYREFTARLEPGDAMIWYTDGLTEGRDDKDREWGERRFLKAVRSSCHLPVQEVRDRLIGEARAFYGTVPPEDDITLIVLRRKRAPATLKMTV